MKGIVIEMAKYEMTPKMVKQLYSCLHAYYSFFSTDAQYWEDIYALSNREEILKAISIIYKEKYGDPSLEKTRYIEPTNEAIAQRITEVMQLAPWEDQAALNEVVALQVQCKALRELLLQELAKTQNTDILSDEELVLWFRNKTGAVNEAQAIRLLNYIIDRFLDSTEDDYDSSYVIDIMGICVDLYESHVELEALDTTKAENETYIDVMIHHCQEIIQAIKKHDGEAAFYHARCIFRVDSLLKRRKS